MIIICKMFSKVVSQSVSLNSVSVGFVVCTCMLFSIQLSLFLTNRTCEGAFCRFSWERKWHFNFPRVQWAHSL